jgi:hypothetical protein
MPDNFGARLRQHRERRGIDLSTVAAQTKIKTSLLEELERGDVSHWPSGIFRRSFIRAYALAIQLEPDPIVREFLERFPDPNDENAPLDALAMVTGGSQGAPPTRLRIIVGSAIGSWSRRRNGSNGASDHGAPAGAIATPTSTASGAAAPVDRWLPAQASDLCDADLLTAASLCTRFGRLERFEEVAPFLKDVARILNATGLILWMWEPQVAGLRAAAAYGYPDDLVSKLPNVKCDAHNATAAAFRSGDAQVLLGSPGASGALAVPLHTPAGCAGVLAIELQDGYERAVWINALAVMLAAPLGRLMRPVASTEVSARAAR